MLQSGLSRELLELWCVDKRNGVIIPGYVVEGTLGRVFLNLALTLVGYFESTFGNSIYGRS